MAGPTRVRTFGVTALVSVVVHGAALAWVINTPKPEAARPVAPRVEVVPEPDPIVVELLPDPVPAATTPRGDETTVVRPGTPTARRAAVSAAATGPRIEIAPPVVVEPPATTPVKPPRGRYTMRSGPEIQTTAEQIVTALLTHPDSTQLPDYPGERNQAALDAARARGDREGVVAAEDALAAEELKPQKDGTFRSNKTTFVAKVDRDGTVHIKDKRNLQVKSLWFAEFDVTDWAMRSHGNDPYASEKLRYLDRTRDQRVEIAKEYRREQLGNAAQLMQANLERLWSVTQAVAARKQGVFDLWDECAETGEPEVVEGGERARALLTRWVQVKLAGAFTTDELVALNAHRRSKASFDPYH